MRMYPADSAMIAPLELPNAESRVLAWEWTFGCTESHDWKVVGCERFSTSSFLPGFVYWKCRRCGARLEQRSSEVLKNG